MGAVRRPKHFDASDLETLERALGLIPNLALAAYLAKLVRERMKYPIEKLSDLKPIIGRANPFQFEGRTITLAEAKAFLPREYFPIEDEQQLLCRLMIVFQRGDFVHAKQDRKKRDVQDPIGKRKAVVIPTPSDCSEIEVDDA